MKISIEIQSFRRKVFVVIGVKNEPAIGAEIMAFLKKGPVSSSV